LLPMEREIEIAEKQLGCSLPGDYVAFRSGLAGEDARIGDRQLFFWPVEELAYYNEGYDVETSAPGLILFGTDGGLEAYGFDTRDGRMTVLTIPFVPMDWREAIPCGRTFTGFLERLRHGGCFSTSGGQGYGDEG